MTTSSARLPAGRSGCVRSVVRRRRYAVAGAPNGARFVPAGNVSSRWARSTEATRSTLRVFVPAAETSTETLLHDHLPRLLRTAGEIGADWARWQSRPHVELGDSAGSATA